MVGADVDGERHMGQLRRQPVQVGEIGDTVVGAGDSTGTWSSASHRPPSALASTWPTVCEYDAQVCWTPSWRRCPQARPQQCGHRDRRPPVIAHPPAAGPGPAAIAEVQRERKNLEGLLGRNVPGGTFTKTQVKALVGALQDIVGVLADADPADKAEMHGELGVSLTYHPDGRVGVEALPRGVVVRVGEGT